MEKEKKVWNMQFLPMYNNNHNKNILSGNISQTVFLFQKLSKTSNSTLIYSSAWNPL